MADLGRGGSGSGARTNANSQSNQQQAGYNYMGSYAPPDQAYVPPTPAKPQTQQTTTTTNSGGGGGGGGGVTAPPPAFSALEIMENFFKQAMGISGMGAWAADLYNRGATPDEIVRTLRYGTDTSDAGKKVREAYLKAFPKMDVFLKEGIFSGSNPEAQYVAYRNTVKEAAQRYGVDESLVSADKIAAMIGGRNSALEIADRMNSGATAIATTPAETFAVLQDYYGIGAKDLMSFYLNTDETEKQIQRKYTAARIGTEAVRDQFGIDKSYAENLADRGISIDEANIGFGKAAAMAGFAVGKGETMGRMDLAESQFGNANAASVAERIAASRVGAFAGDGRYESDKGGIVGLTMASQ